VALVIRDAHYPGRAPIDTYGNGGFRFAGMSHRGSLLCIPSGIYGWPGPAGDTIDVASLERAFAEAADIEVLLLGTGVALKPADAAVKARCRELGIVAEAMSTGAAVRTYNVLLAEGRAIAAALMAVA
jgi:uncharacterized protein